MIVRALVAAHVTRHPTISPSRRRPRLARAALLGAALATVVLGASTAPALAGTFTLNLAPQADAVVGRPLIIQATGTIPPESVQFPYWFSLDAIPTAVTRTCPADRWVGAQFGNSSGAIVVLTQAETPDLAGNFAIPVVVTPSASGSVLLCGYTDDGAAATLAGASLILDIKPRRETLRQAKARCRRLHPRRARARCLRRARRG